MTGQGFGLLMVAGSGIALVALILGVFFHQPRRTDE